MYPKFPQHLLVGTSSWSSPDWCGSFYPASTEPGEMIRIYSTKLPTVEIDSTWYAMPSRSMIEAWRAKTPEGFVFSAKIPKVISHDKYLEGCEAELNEFVSVMSGLGEKLGPIILQFPYFAKGKDPQEYQTGADFIRRLKGFVPLLPPDFKWGVEIRNARWIQPALLDILRSRDVSLVFIDYYTMDPLPKLVHRSEIFTAPFVYIRFLGNRKEIETAVKQAQDAGLRKRDWESILKDRTGQMKAWIPSIQQVLAKKIPVYVYFNNHYAGYAPGSVELFEKLFQNAAPGSV
ncbi:MAG TPA: DUF72 domain-containing protein [Acidobacteriota bacterium]|nr:DUF72 domain-containing protein [Acidobacteriota bacterium]